MIIAKTLDEVKRLAVQETVRDNGYYIVGRDTLELPQFPRATFLTIKDAQGKPYVFRGIFKNSNLLYYYNHKLNMAIAVQY